MPEDKGLSGFIKNKVLGIKSKVVSTSEMRPSDARGMAAHLYSVVRDQYYLSLKTARDRIAKYNKFKFLDENLAEGSASLNVYADNIVSGAIGGEENFKIGIDKNLPNKKDIEEKISLMETRTGIKDQIWEIARHLTRDGDIWTEIVYFKNEKKEVGIQKLKRLPHREIYADVDKYGQWKNEDKPYVQRADYYQETGGTPFDDWRLIHFKIGSDVYGVNNSLFNNASQRIGRQLLWIDDSMVLARLSRAWMRYAYYIDTTGLVNPDDKFEYVEKWKAEMKQTAVIDRTTGRIDYDSPPPLPDEDIFIPVEKDSKQDVKQLVGDMNIGNIEDVKYFQSKFFMAVNLPKVYGGIEEGVRAKATIGQIDVQFARQVRRRQNALKPGLRKFYEYFFVLMGIDPDSFKWSVVFPPLATLDEMLKWQMENIKANIAKRYVVEIGVLNNQWVMEEILGFNEEQISKYQQVMPQMVTPGGKGGGMDITPEMIAMIKRDPYLRHFLNELRDMLSWKMSYEEDVIGKDLVGDERDDPLEVALDSLGRLDRGE